MNKHGKNNPALSAGLLPARFSGCERRIFMLYGQKNG
jgi:hypothetical protein